MKPRVNVIQCKMKVQQKPGPQTVCKMPEDMVYNLNEALIMATENLKIEQGRKCTNIIYTVTQGKPYSVQQCSPRASLVLTVGDGSTLDGVA